MAFVIVLFLLAFQRGEFKTVLWSVSLLSIAAVSLAFPRHCIPFAGLASFAFGFVRTFQGDFGNDLGMAFIAVAVSGYVIDRARREKRIELDFAALSLLLIALLSVISLVFFLFKVLSFAPAPGFSYQVYAFNPLGLPSDSVFTRVFVGALNLSSWFALYLFARDTHVARRLFGYTVLAVLLANSGVLLYQQFFDQRFLLPAGGALDGRFNGLTSYCYSLGAVIIGCFLLLPLWWGKRGRGLILPVALVVLILHAVIASGSRNALLAIIGAGLLWTIARAFMLLKQRKRGRAAIILGVTLAIAIVPLTLYYVTPSGMDTPFARLKYGIERDGLFGHLQTTRLNSYPLHFAVIGAYPLSGVGAGAYFAEVSKQRDLLVPHLLVLDPYLLTSYAPNMILNVGVELGLLALLLLIVVFFHAGMAYFRSKSMDKQPYFLISLIVLTLALQFGPEMYNSEALVFLWMVIGFAARGGASPGTPELPEREKRIFGSGVTLAILAVLAVVTIAGQWFAAPSLAIRNQWDKLRWHIEMGVYPAEPGGRWTRSEATFVTRSPARELTLHWHAGDPAAPEYTTSVSFYVDGRLVETTRAESGFERESILPLPSVDGFKMISVRVSQPFVPALMLNSSDERRLGIFINAED